MSLSTDRLISITLTKKTAISELLEGWQYWIELGLISEQLVNARIVSGNEQFQANFKTSITITNLIKQLQNWQAPDLFTDGTAINFTVNIKTADTALLIGLDRWLQLGLLDHQQVKKISYEHLTSTLPAVISKTLQPISNPSLSPNSQLSKVPRKRLQPPKIGQIVQSLMAELSVIWLLLLGVFMVVISSGVLAASWWEKFPAFLQYGILWLYTLGFGFASWWTGKQPNLRLTTQALRIVTLLLVPINFFAMDSFTLWHTFLGLVVIFLGSVSLTILTINYFKDNSSYSSSFLPLLNHLGLTYLHWGWTMPGVPLIATYIGVIGTTVLTLLFPQNTNKKSKKFLPFSLTESIIIYALVILLVRAIFIAQVNIFQLGLAIGMCGWLMAWHSPPKTPWKWVGSSLVTLGWLLSVFTVPSQAIAISLLAIIGLVKHLKKSGSRRDFFLIFIIGLQIHWLLSRLPSFENFFIYFISTTKTENMPFVWLSLGLFPYLIILILFRKIFIKNNQVKVSKFSGYLAFLLGINLTIISLFNPLLRSINLLLSTLTLAYETRSQLKSTTSPLKTFALITHVTFLLTIGSIINYFFSTLSINIWSVILLGLMIVEIFLSFICLPEESVLNNFNKSTWNMGLFLGAISYGLFWFNLPFNSPFWSFSWLIVPSFMTTIATWYLPRRQLASELSVIAASIMQALTIFFPETRLIGLIIATVLMVINTRYLRHFVSASITVGFGLTSIFFYLYSLNLYPSLWILSGVIITLLLWFIRHVLIDNTSDLSVTYAKVFDSYAYALSFIVLIRLIDIALIYTSATNTFISSILLIITVAYRSWQPSLEQNKSSLWYSVLILAIVPLPPLSLPSWGWITLAIATILMVVQTQIIKQVKAALIAIGFVLGLMMVILEENGLRYSEEFWAYWLLIGTSCAILFWIIRYFLSYYQFDFISYYKPALNIWAISLCSLVLVALTLLSFAFYWDYMASSLGSITAALLLFTTIFYHSYKRPNNWIVYILGWSLELLIINILEFFDQSLIILAITNVILGICIQIIGEWWQKRTGKVHFLSSWHILPLIYGALGAALRWNYFNSWTGLTSLGLALIIIGIGRRKQQFKPLIYIAMGVFSWSAYELLFYQISTLPWGDRCLSMAALATTIMYFYRLSSPWLSSYLHLTQSELKVFAHLHWFLGSSFLGISLLYPVTSQQLIGLSAGIFLSQYAIMEGRNFLEPRQGEIWVYLGFLEGASIAIYAALNIPPIYYLNYFFERWIGTVLALLSVVVYSLPWRQWGWSKRPWSLLAFCLPLVGVFSTISELNYLTLLLAAICYAILSKMANRPRLFYLSLILINVVVYDWIDELNKLDPILYSSLLCLSILLIIIIEPICQGEEGKKIRHYLRLIATGIICTISLLFYTKTGIIPGTISLLLIAMGLSLRTRAFLFSGTITFILNVFYQLVIVSFTYTLLKWIIGLLIGLTLIWIAASFENRRTQISTLINHWMREFEVWD